MTERITPERRDLVDMAWDPITRIIGNLGIYTKIDFANQQVTECHSTSSLFRGYSVFMNGKDPRDAGFITSRICGICGDNHTTCSVYAQQMAYGIKPPPQAENIVNLGEAAEYMFDHTIFQDNLVFVDFCEAMVKQTNPGVLAKAENTPARPTNCMPRRQSSTNWLLTFRARRSFGIVVGTLSAALRASVSASLVDLASTSAWANGNARRARPA